MSRRTVGVVVAFLLGAGAARAGEVIHEGVRVRFELVRVPAGPEDPVVEAVGGSATGIHRVLLDREHGRYFGYTVHVSALGGGRYRVRIGPLAREWREQWGRLHGEMAGDPEAIEYPEPVEVDAGEPLLFELLSNRAHGETLHDRIRVEPFDPEHPFPLPAAQPGEIRLVDAVVRVNGRAMDGRGGVVGRHVSFFVCGKGRFVVSRERVANLEMQAVTVEDPKAIRFTAGGDRFEWVSAEPIVTAPALVFVWHDRGHQCRPGEVFGVGTDPAPGGRLPGR